MHALGQADGDRRAGQQLVDERLRRGLELRRRARRGWRGRSARPPSPPISLPVMISSLARPRPTTCGSREEPPTSGISPTRVSGMPMSASAAITRRSQASASSIAPPMQAPWIWQIDRLGHLLGEVPGLDARAPERAQHVGLLGRGRRASRGPCRRRTSRPRRAARRSAPPGRRRRRAAPRRWRAPARWLNALRFSGRLRTTWRTAPRSSVSTRAMRPQATAAARG